MMCKGEQKRQLVLSERGRSMAKDEYSDASCALVSNETNTLEVDF